MKTFGAEEMLWRGETTSDMHVIVATRGSAWEHLCYAEAEWSPPKRGRREYETVEKDPKPTRDPVVWRHDRSKVTCQRCLVALGRLDPGFKPSDVVMVFPPLTDTMGRAEVEAAAALIVRVCQVREDAWQEVEPIAVAEVIKDDLEAKRDLIHSMEKSLFIRPDFHDLVKRGFAEWAGVGEGPFPIRLTQSGLAAIKKWVRS